MKRLCAIWPVLMASAGLLTCLNAGATTQCVVGFMGSPAPVNIPDPTSGQQVVSNIMQFTCTRDRSGDPSSGKILLSLATSGTLTRTTSPANTINHAITWPDGTAGLQTTDTAANGQTCAAGTAPSSMNGTLVVSANISGLPVGSNTPTLRYKKVCITVPKPGVAPMAGTYNETVTFTSSMTTTSGLSGNGYATKFYNPVYQVTVPVSCAIASLPNLAINYTSFTDKAVDRSVAVSQVNCTPGTSWSADLRVKDATAVTNPLTGTLLGINYSLGLSTSDGVPIGALNPVLTGLSGSQTIYFKGRAAPGQAGTCSTATCSSSQTYTLSVNF